MKNKEQNSEFFMMSIIVKKKRWWPVVMDEQISWFGNWKLHLPDFTSELTLTVAELAQAQKDADMFLYLFAIEPALRDYIAELMAYRLSAVSSSSQISVGAPPVWSTTLVAPTTVLGGILDRTFNFVKALRTRGGFTPAIAVALKINGDDIAPFDTDAYIANGRGKTTVDYILLKYTRGEFIDGMIIESRRNGGDWEQIAHTNEVSFKDKRYNLIDGQPETREYRFRAYIKDVLIGNYSSVFSITWTSPVPPPPPPPPLGPVPPVV